MKLKWTVPIVVIFLLAAGCRDTEEGKPMAEQPNVTEDQQPENNGGETEKPSTSPGQGINQPGKPAVQPGKATGQPQKPSNQPGPPIQQNIQIRDESIVKENPIINIVYPQIDGLKDKMAQDKLNAILKEKANNVDESQMTNEDPNAPSSFYSKYKITFQNEHLISFVYDQYFYLSGAAHGMPSRIPILVDLDKGRIVEANELFSNALQTKQIISELVLRQDVLHTLDAMGEFKQISSDDLKQVYVTKEGLMMYFPPYEYASYAEGTLQYHLAYSDIQNVLNAAFFKSHGIDISQPTDFTTIYFTEGYHFSVPKEWMDRLIFERADYEENNPWFSEINLYSNTASKPLLLSFHMYEKQVWTALNPAGVEVKLTEDSDIIYSYIVTPYIENDPQLNEFLQNIVPKMMKTFQLDN
ncbi:PdaC/SigV domain-containing protein [Neobacillus dielmonensis]|uniref:PdaC/SigV domain-containing protein n=1 Tax=Neobacillus dielmonensis TaxID=1347369 RepID=UPI0005A611B0|nr:DUF4163 domain-containing protein [Neobacillus dielmonensis]